MDTKLSILSRTIRYHLIRMTTAAGSGHLSSSLSAVELMTGLMFGGVFKADLKKPDYHNNDRLVFSKGHAAPLLYALYAAAGVFPAKNLLSLRRFKSRFSGHPMPPFVFTETPTGSLGQGLSVALGEALAARLDRLTYRVYCLLGDSELSEGSNWEAIELAGFLKVGNLVGILDLNRLGQSGQTMLGWDAKTYSQRLTVFGWHTITIDGHDLKQVTTAYERAMKFKDKPVMIIARTKKGKGVAMMEDQDGWHGKVLTKDEAKLALKALGQIENIKGLVTQPKKLKIPITKTKAPREMKYKLGEIVAPRLGLGQALVRLASAHPRLVVLDGEVKNSTYAELIADKYPKRFIQGYIAEQNIVGLAGGLAKRGFLPVFATFAAFLTRAHDQLRMQAYSDTHQIYIGNHVGVHIGADGPSQMGLEDIAMFRGLHNSTVLYPADAVSAEKLLEQALKNDGLIYLRATRNKLPVIYPVNTRFPVGGSKILRHSKKDMVTIVAAGVTVHEALKAADVLTKRKIEVRVIDLYSVKPLDVKTIKQAARETKKIIVVEDHRPEGGIGEAVMSALGKDAGKVISLAVRKLPPSGQPEELMAYEGIDANAIIKEVIKLNR